MDNSILRVVLRLEGLGGVDEILEIVAIVVGHGVGRVPIVVAGLRGAEGGVAHTDGGDVVQERAGVENHQADKGNGDDDGQNADKPAGQLGQAAVRSLSGVADQTAGFILFLAFFLFS